MDFNEKLQELRRRRGLTQEELAEALYVSRTAISKWESGRGYPSIDSLKRIAAFFSVSLDELLSSDQVLTIAEEDTRQKERSIRDLVFGLLDVSAVMFFLLPLFAERLDGSISEVSLLNLSGVAGYLRFSYIFAVASVILCGILTLALQGFDLTVWGKIKTKLSLGLSGACALLFIVTLQANGAAFMFIFLVIKALMLIKWQ